MKGALLTLPWCAYSHTSGHPQAHPVPHTANNSEILALTPQALLPSRLPPEAVTPPLSGKGWVVSSASPPPHRWGAAAAVAQMCAASGEATAGGFPPPATRAARALSSRCPPRPSPGQQLCPAPRPQPLSQLSLGWGRAAGEQLQSVEGGEGRVPPQQQETVLGLGAGRGEGRQGGRRGRGRGNAGGRGRRGRGWSTPPPLPQ